MTQRAYREVIAAVLLTAMLLITALWSGGALTTPTLRDLLSRLTVVSCGISLALAAIGLVLTLREFRTHTIEISRRTKYVLTMLLLSGFIVAFTIVPRTNRLFFDEHIYQAIGQAIVETGQAVLNNEGNTEFGQYQIRQGEYNKEPNGFPFYLALFFGIFGTRSEVAHLANNFAFILGAGGIFLLALQSFRSEWGALVATLFYLLSPTMLQWSNTVAAEPAAAAFATVALALARLFATRLSSIGLLLATSGVGALAMQFRPEGILLVVPFYLFLAQGGRGTLFEPRFYWFTLLLSIQLVVPLLHLYTVIDEQWGAETDRFSIDFFWKYLISNLSFFLQNDEYPLVFTGFALLGLFVGEYPREKGSLIAWFLVSFIVFLFFYAGSYRVPSSVRYTILTIPPISLLASLGAIWAKERLASARLPRDVGASAIVLLVVFSAITFLPFARSVGPAGAEARFDVGYVESWSKLLPPQSLVLSHTPMLWQMQKRNAAQLSLASTNPDRLPEFLSAYPGGVYFHFGIWCHGKYPAQVRFCETAMKQLELQVFDEHDTLGYRYALYRIVGINGTGGNGDR